MKIFSKEIFDLKLLSFTLFRADATG